MRAIRGAFSQRRARRARRLAARARHHPADHRAAGARRSDGYEIIAGERRWRAAQRAGLHEVPVVVIEATDAEALQLAIIENVQRADLNPLEEAEGYRALMEEFGNSQDEIAKIVGKSRSHVANTLRLLTLPDR
jgi:ParB family chromosome partitioning protein